MPIGLSASLSKVIIDGQLGTIAQQLNVVMEDIDNLKFFLDTLLDPDLEALGYTVDDITLLRTCTNDMNELKTIYIGAAALAEAKDFRTFIRRVWGTGFSGT